MLEKPKTLAEILAWLDAVDQGLIAATPEDQAHVGALLVAKIDNTKGVLDELEFQEKRLRAAAKELETGAGQVASRVKRMKSYMAHHMKAHGFTHLPGEVWKARLTGGVSAEPNYKTPVKGDVEKAPHLVRVKYEWDKKALKAALEVGDEHARLVASLVESNSVSIGAYKGPIE